MHEQQIQRIRRQAVQYFYKRCPPQEVDDLVQDCLYRVLLAEARGLRVGEGLVHHICHALWVDYLRRQDQRKNSECAIEMDCACVPWEEELHIRMDLEVCLRGLTDSERDLVHRHYIAGETYAFIGEQLGISEQAVRKRLQRLKEKLRALLAGYEGG